MNQQRRFWRPLSCLLDDTPKKRTFGIVCAVANLHALRLVLALQSPIPSPLIHLTSGAQLVQVGSCIRPRKLYGWRYRLRSYVLRVKAECTAIVLSANERLRRSRSRPLPFQEETSDCVGVRCRRAPKRSRGSPPPLMRRGTHCILAQSLR